MLIKRESDYGIRIVRALKDGEKQSVKEICREEEIPEAFAYKILKKMQVAGIVCSGRGAMGGYWLAKDTSQITLYDVMLAVEPEFAVTACMRTGCSRNTQGSPCKVHTRLIQVQNSIVAQLRQQSMAEILKE